MFTGIIEEIGSIKKISQSGNAIEMTILAKKVLEDVHLGDSIAVNGVCLTVTNYTKQDFVVDIMPESVKATSLRDLNIGSKVNLERAMGANGRFGGHFVSGHVDGTGKIVQKRPEENAVYYDIEVDEDVSKYILYKGSITVDGTSLTVFGVKENVFTLSLIPHTLTETIIGLKKEGDIVNIECDMLGKYIEKFLSKRFEQPATKSSISESFLKEHGYL